jgi:hypothetical protein
LKICVMRHRLHAPRDQNLNVNVPTTFRRKQPIELVEQCAGVALGTGNPLAKKLSVDVYLFHERVSRSTYRILLLNRSFAIKGLSPS